MATNLCNLATATRIFLSMLGVNNQRRLAADPGIYQDKSMAAPMPPGQMGEVSTEEKIKRSEEACAIGNRRLIVLDGEIARESKKFAIQARRDRASPAGIAECRRILAARHELMQERKTLAAGIMNLTQVIGAHRKVGTSSNIMSLTKELTAAMPVEVRERLLNSASETASDAKSLIKDSEKISEKMSKPFGSVASEDWNEDDELQAAFAELDEAAASELGDSLAPVPIMAPHSVSGGNGGAPPSGGQDLAAAKKAAAAATRGQVSSRPSFTPVPRPVLTGSEPQKAEGYIPAQKPERAAVSAV